MAEIVKNLSEGSIELPQVSAPGTTTDKLYNVGGALTFNGTDISAGGGLVDIIDDTTPQLGGDLDVNGYDITTINGAGNGITLVTSAASPSGSSGNVSIGTANSNALVNSLVQGQDETDYTFDFNGGTGHAVSDVITMTDGSTVTVDSLSGSAVLTFTVTTSGGVDVPIQPHPQNLLQSSTTGSGTGFLLQPQGNNVVQDAQTGGNLTLTAGDGGTSTTGGGDVVITSGRQRGEVLISTGDARTTGNGAYAGKINIEVGTSFQNSGENVNIFGGDADYEGGDAFGGDVRIVAGNAFGTGGDPDNSYGGDVRIEGGRALYGGSGALPYEGGDVNLDGGQSSYYGGNVNITSGDTTGADGIAGNIILQTPDGGYGASIRMYGGAASFASAAGADIRIKAGNSASGHGGDVEFTFGTAPGDAGAMVINTSVAPSSTTNKLYNVAGALTWNGTDLTAGGGGGDEIVDADGDTRVMVEESADEDIIRFDTGDAITNFPSNDNTVVISSAEFSVSFPNANTATQIGGTVNLTAGKSFSADGGVVNIIGGLSGLSENGGAVNITGGAADPATNGYEGGKVIISGGQGHEEHGGNVEIYGGSTTNGAVGGSISLTTGSPSTGAAGNISLFVSPSIGSSQPGQPITLNAGEGGLRDGGGDVRIYGGASNSTSGDGGSILLQAAYGVNGTSAHGIGGDITITPGAGAGSGSAGAIVITATAAPTVTTNKLYNVAGALTWNGTDLTAGGGGGGLTVVVVTSTSATAAAAQATMVDDDTAAGVVTITLPAGSANDQQVIKKLGTTANVIVDGDSAETIDGAATFTLTAQYASVTLIWNGTEWSII